MTLAAPNHVLLSACVCVPCVHRQLRLWALASLEAFLSPRLALRSSPGIGAFLLSASRAPIRVRRAESTSVDPHPDSHATDRHLPRTSRLVQAALRRAGSARTAVRAPRRRGARLRSVGGRRAVLARRQSREPVGVSARPRAVDVPHAALAAAPRAASAFRSSTARSVYAFELSKASQLDLLEELGLPYPRVARDQPSVARRRRRREGLRYPVLVKANIGGSGAGIVRYETRSRARRRGRARRSRARHRRRRAGAGVRAAARRPHRPRRDARRQVSLRDQGLSGGRLVRSLPGRRLPDDERRRARARRLRGRRAEDRPARRRLHAAAPRSSRRSKRSRARGSRHRRHRVSRRRSRRQALLLRHQRALELRRRSGERDRLRSVGEASSTISRRASRARQSRERSSRTRLDARSARLP